MYHSRRDSSIRSMRRSSRDEPVCSIDDVYAQWNRSKQSIRGYISPLYFLSRYEMHLSMFKFHQKDMPQFLCSRVGSNFSPEVTYHHIPPIYGIMMVSLSMVTHSDRRLSHPHHIVGNRFHSRTTQLGTHCLHVNIPCTLRLWWILPIQLHTMVHTKVILRSVCKDMGFDAWHDVLLSTLPHL